MNDKRKRAIIVDLDDTFYHADKSLGAYLNWEMFIPRAKPNAWCQNIVKVYSKAGYTIIFLTARLEIYRQQTTDRLFENGVYPYQYELFMYPHKHYRASISLSNFKVETIKKDLLPHYSIEFAIDDSIDNVVAINKLGIKCLWC